jgi:hypothetical protein
MRTQVDSREIGLIVGNGLMFDFIEESGFDLQDWHPQRFSEWGSPAELLDGRPVLEVLPYFSDFMRNYRCQDPEATDFDVFDAIGKRATPNFDLLQVPNNSRALFEYKIVDAEACHFIARSLDWLERSLVTSEIIHRWRWSQWIGDHANQIGAITSFNYDTLIETAMSETQTDFHRPSLRECTTDSILLHKPHGSIDYETAGITVGNISYPLQDAVSRNNTPIRLVQDRGNVTVDCELVLPSSASEIEDFQWVAAGRDGWRRLAPGVKHLVLAGLSYWECDREELDALVNQVPTNAIIYMCNPNPCEEWLEKLKLRFAEVHELSDPPEI